MSGVRKINMKEAGLSVEDAMIVCIIISKGNVREVGVAKKRITNYQSLASVTNSSNSNTGVWKFTVRDEIHSANCTMWGNIQYIHTMYNTFTVGDVVDIIRPRFKLKIIGDQNERYSPEVTLSFNIVISENVSEMLIHDAEDGATFLPLLHIPTKAPRGYFTLADILNNEIRDDFVDLLVAVQSVLPARTVRTKVGGESSCREIIVCDQSTVTTFRIVLWDQDVIRRSSSWSSRETILFIADIKLVWSEFHKGLIGNVTSRTIITDDPYTSEAEALRVYVINSPQQITQDVAEFNLPDPNTIKTIMTIQQIIDRVTSMKECCQFTAVLYAVITKLDLDGSYKNVNSKCSQCSNPLKSPTSSCQNKECQMNDGKIEHEFNVRVSLSDYTGTLNNCRLTANHAEELFNCTAEEFLNLSSNTKGQMKWKWLMERSMIKVVVSKGPVVHIVACSQADPDELINKLPIY